MPASKKILIITYYWPPAGGPGVQRWLKFAKYLPGSGVEPFILTVDDERASYPIRDASLNAEVSPGLQVFRTPTRELYSLYLRITGRENVPFSGFVQESKPNFTEKLIRFLRTQLFIPDPRKGWNKFAFRKACEIIRQENIQNVVTTGPPHSTHLTGRHLKKNFPDLNWIADFRDPWTRIFFFNQLGHSFISKHIHKHLEKKVLQESNKVLVVGNSMKMDFLSDHQSLPESRIEILPNGFDEEDFLSDLTPPGDKFIISYTGTLAGSYRMDALAEAVAAINKTTDKRILLRVVGEISDDIRNLLRKKLIPDDLEILASVDHKRAIEYMQESHMLLLVLPDTSGNKCILTGKLFEYLAAKRPILGIGPKDGDAAYILHDTGAGIMFGYDETGSIQQYILDVKMNVKPVKDLTVTHRIAGYSRARLSAKFSELLI